MNIYNHLRAIPFECTWGGGWNAHLLKIMGGGGQDEKNGGLHEKEIMGGGGGGSEIVSIPPPPPRVFLNGIALMMFLQM